MIAIAWMDISKKLIHAMIATTLAKPVLTRILINVSPAIQHKEAWPIMYAFACLELMITQQIKCAILAIIAVKNVWEISLISAFYVISMITE